MDQFWLLPKFAVDELGLREALVLAILYTRMNGDNNAWPGQTYLADKAHVSPRQIVTILKTLQKAGYIEVTRRGLGRTNVYRLHIRSEEIAHQEVNTNFTSGSEVATALLYKGSEENSIKRTDTIAARAAWDWNDARLKMWNDKRPELRILAMYYNMRGFTPENTSQLSAAISRDIRAAGKIAGYSLKRVEEVIRWLRDNADYKWTLETVHKYIDDNLAKMKKSPDRVVRIPSQKT